MHLNGISKTETKEIANLFGQNFASVYSKEVVIPHEITYSRFTQLDHTNVIISESEVSSALLKLKEGAARGVDDISPVYFKKCAVQLARPLTLLFNESLQTGVFPNKWKVALITPIHKSGPKNEIKNYRPVSIISIIPKLLEKLIYDKIKDCLNPLIIDSQYGFMKRRSTMTNLVSFSHYVGNSLDSGCQVDCIYTDFSKAYDKLNHNILIAKLSAFGISGYLLQWIRNFLSGRIQIVRVGTSTSEPIHIPSGCIQGGHMSGLLFSLFINDIAEIFPDFNFWLFADDLKVALRVGGQRDVDSMQNMLSRLYHWCSINKMELNIGKCMVMTYHRNKSPILASYNINGQALARCEQVRDLGVTFQKTLEFNSHINNIKSKALKMLGFLYRNSREFSSVTTLKALYYAYVRQDSEKLEHPETS
ncbi:hypothetical protein M8J77_018492 [Diaphorina citri]|nr:hypothetical protein M8J77_018492 [Diaphorina citri]